jgi:ATP-dependent DNA helicase RecQ
MRMNETEIELQEIGSGQSPAFDGGTSAFFAEPEIAAERIGRKLLGIDELFPHQRNTIGSVMSGSDALTCVPTGGGKSLCYLLPAMMLPNVTIVVSPLISLMRDQFTKYAALGFPCDAMDSLQESDKRNLSWKNLEDGRTKILFVSPERLARPQFRERLHRVGVSLVAIDEAHCVSQWGYNFRPDYRKIGEYLEDFANAPRLALTASATEEVRRDIVKALGLRLPKVILSTVTRSNLHIKVIKAKSVEQQLTNAISLVPSMSGVGIIYAPTRKKVEEIARVLAADGTPVARYHAGLLPDERNNAQRVFMEGKVKAVVATTSFGMGIDKSDVRFVIHAGMPQCPEQYVQEIGRAGRDQLPAKCIMLYGPRDFFLQRFLLELSFPEADLLFRTYNAAVEILKVRRWAEEAWFLKEVWTAVKCNREDLESAVQLLCREGLLLVLKEGGPTSDGRAERLVTIGVEGARAKEFWFHYPSKRQRYFEKLRCMLEFAKLEGDHAEWLNRYFGSDNSST